MSMRSVYSVWPAVIKCDLLGGAAMSRVIKNVFVQISAIIFAVFKIGAIKCQMARLESVLKR